MLIYIAMEGGEQIDEYGLINQRSTPENLRPIDFPNQHAFINLEPVDVKMTII